MPTQNPFLHTLFINTWIKHCKPHTKPLQIQGIKHLQFYKAKGFKLYKNIGDTLTHGLHYQLEDSLPKRLNKVCMVYDVLEDTPTPNTHTQAPIAIKKIQQYKGYKIHTNRYKTLEDYTASQLSSKTRWKLKRAAKRLHSCFEIRYETFTSTNINSSTYEMLVDTYHALLDKRTQQQQHYNHWLTPEKQAFFKDLFWALLQDDQALVFVIYKQDTPISITFNYLANNSMILGAPVFDNAFEKFNLGYLSTLNQLSWCIAHDIETFDFSKGHYPYKKRLADTEYHFYYHIIYNKKHLLSKLLAAVLSAKYNTKQWLRTHNIDSLWSRLLFRLKQQTTKPYTLQMTPLAALPDAHTLELINYNEAAYAFLKPTVYHTAFKHVLPENKLRLYKTRHSKKSFILEAQTTYLHILVV